MIRSAKFSTDQKKRFELIRDWSDEIGAGPLRTVNFISLNPSKAGADDDDATVRKDIGFARRWGFNRVVLTNMVPIISTDPWALPPWRGIDMENRAYQQEWMGSADLVVAAWGAVPSALARTIALPELIYLLTMTAPVDLYCIGTTQKGAPLHPSRCPYVDAPVLWRKAQA